jgi:hypothetical protein
MFGDETLWLPYAAPQLRGRLPRTRSLASQSGASL